MGNILASSIRSKPHLTAFDETAEAQFAAIDFVPMLVYLIDTVDASALGDLLDQFDLMGYKGARFVSTDQEKRDLIKKGIELKKYTGTPWAIKEALKLIGVTDVEFLKMPLTVLHNSTIMRDGTYGHNSVVWARFSVKINAATFPVITTQLLSDIVALVTQYKPRTRRLIDVIGFGLLHNGVALRDGTYDRSTQVYHINN